EPLKFRRIHKIDPPKIKDCIVQDEDRLNFFFPVSSGQTDPETQKMPALMLKDYGYVGNEGEQVRIEKKLFRYNLFPKGIATYCSNENILAMQERMKKKLQDHQVNKLDVLSKRIADSIRKIHFPIYMNCLNKEWTLTEKNIKINLRFQ
ncbi:MAG: 54S ribosomal protein L9, mitochondrial, partial [Paramarteilia canceri]